MSSIIWKNKRKSLLNILGGAWWKCKHNGRFDQTLCGQSQVALLLNISIVFFLSNINPILRNDTSRSKSSCAIRDPPEEVVSACVDIVPDAQGVQWVLIKLKVMVIRIIP